LITVTEEELSRGIGPLLRFLHATACEVLVTPVPPEGAEILVSVASDVYERVFAALMPILGCNPRVTIVGVAPTPVLPVDTRPRCIRCARAIGVDGLEAELSIIVGARGSLQGVTVLLTCPSCGGHGLLNDPRREQRELLDEITH
jgi:hypothetical protein